MKRIIKESGIRDINNLAKRYKKAKIYFHQDLDGVTTALAMKNYLEQNGINVVDAEIIQYGNKEFAIKKPEGEGDVMPVLVDFAHGKPMFVIHTDHHDSQAGVEGDTATSFRHSRSNVETISQILSPKEIFTPEDIFLISTVDSANFAANSITPEMVMNYLFKYDKNESLKRNKLLMGLVVNKLLLAYKNKPNFLEDIVLNAKPSLLSILNFIRKEASEKGYASPDILTKNKEDYVQSRKESGVERTGNVLSQYGFGSTTKPGAYDRYTPFRNNPDADFLVTGMPMGIVQASCNPFKESRALKGINLGEIKDQVLLDFKPELEKQILTFKTIKKIAEREATKESVGFTSKDMMALYGSMPSYDSEKQSINGYDFIIANSGGHKCITNISGINFLYSGYDKPYTKDLPKETLPIAFYEGNNSFVKDIKQKLLKFRKLSEKQIQMALSTIKKEGINVDVTSDQKSEKSSVDLVKEIQDRFVEILNKKVRSESESINENKKVNKPFIYRKQGKHDNLPGLNIKYLTPKEEITGYVNILDYENSKLIDPDIPRFEKNSDKFCKCNCKKDHFNSKNTLYLYDLRVFDEHQGNGYSKKLMNKCHQISKDNGYKYVSLITDCDNTPAQNLYKKLGYKLYQTDGKKDFYFKEL